MKKRRESWSVWTWQKKLGLPNVLCAFCENENEPSVSVCSSAIENEKIVLKRGMTKSTVFFSLYITLSITIPASIYVASEEELWAYLEYRNEESIGENKM